MPLIDYDRGRALIPVPTSTSPTPGWSALRMSDQLEIAAIRIPRRRRCQGQPELSSELRMDVMALNIFTDGLVEQVAYPPPAGPG